MIDEIVLRSVGVDVGSATMSFSLSHVHLRKVGTRYRPVSRQTVHRSPVTLTPYRPSSDTIDGAAVTATIGAEFASAGITSDTIDTGAVILTGLARQRRNARAVAEAVAASAGRFVAVSAGDDLEATMAAHGSGTVAYSAEHDGVFLNVDVGGGTTKLSLCRGGRVLATAAVDVGARIVRFDEDGMVTGCESFLADFAVATGRRCTAADREQLARRLVAEVTAAVPYPPGTGTSRLLRGRPLTATGYLAGISVSGGVAEYAFGRERRHFGDLGPELGRALLDELRRFDAPVLELGGGLHATAVGLAEQVAHVSGDTVYRSPGAPSRIRDVPVVAPRLLLDEVLNPAAVACAVAEQLDLAGVARDAPAGIAVSWAGRPTYDRLRALARGLIAGTNLRRRPAVVFLCDTDIGQLLGRRIAELCPDGIVVSLDGVQAGTHDYIDVGLPQVDTGAVPVVVKSLVF